MTDRAPQRTTALAARIGLVSAVVMFVLSILVWTDALPFLGLRDDTRPLIAGALLFAGLLDLGVGVVMTRRAR